MATIEELINHLDIAEPEQPKPINIFLYEIMKEAKVLSKNWKYTWEYLYSYIEKVEGFPFEATPEMKYFLIALARGFSDGYNLKTVFIRR